MSGPSGTASASKRTNERNFRRELPEFRKRRTNVPTACWEARRNWTCAQEEKGRAALEELFSTSRRQFWAMAYSILKNSEDAEDAVQDAFVSAHRHLRSFEGRSALKTWCTRIVMNAALMIERKRRATKVAVSSESAETDESDLMASIPDPRSDLETAQTAREKLELVDSVLTQMKPVLRQAFALIYFDELSGVEASEFLGISSGAFKARLFRAKNQVLDRTARVIAPPFLRTLVRRSITSGELL